MADSTPGPWRVMADVPVLRTGDVFLGQQVWAGMGPRIAFTERQNVGEAVEAANARLIAAAPQMLRALELAEGALAVRGSLRDGEQARVEMALETVRQVLAIARPDGAEVAQP